MVFFCLCFSFIAGLDKGGGCMHETYFVFFLFFSNNDTSHNITYTITGEATAFQLYSYPFFIGLICLIVDLPNQAKQAGPSICLDTIYFF